MGPGQIAGISSAVIGQATASVDAKPSLPLAVGKDYAPKVEQNPQGGNLPLGNSKFIVPFPESNMAIQLTNPPTGYLTQARVSQIVGANPKQYMLETVARDIIKVPPEQLNKETENDRYVFTCNKAGVPIVSSLSLSDKVVFDPPVIKTMMTGKDQGAVIAEVAKQHPSIFHLYDRDENGKHVVGDQERTKIKEAVKIAFGIPKDITIGLEVAAGKLPNIGGQSGNAAAPDESLNRVVGMSITIEGQKEPFLSTASFNHRG